MIRNIFFLLLLIPFGCTPKQVTVNDSEKKIAPEAIEIVVDTETTENLIYFKILNHSDSSILIYSYQMLHIERDNNGTWEKLRILAFPCGAPGAKPSEFIEVPKGNHFDFSWNKEESWCGERNESFIPETITAPAASGNYRIKIIYSQIFQEQKIIYKEFTI